MIERETDRDLIPKFTQSQMDIQIERIAALEAEVERLRDCLRKDPNVMLIAYEDGDHERLVNALSALQAKIDGAEPVGKWAIDRSTPSPILTYENCSVIQDEQAFYVWALIRRAADLGKEGGECK